MEIYLTRHGLTKGNIDNIIQGQTEGELVKEGFDQAKLLGKKLNEIKFNNIYCSDLNRTKQTLKEILKQLKHPIEENSISYTSSLREINIKSLEGMSCDIEEKIRNDPKLPYRMNNTGDKGDETYVDVFFRLSKFIDSIIQKFIDKDYNSGINENNYIELNNNIETIEKEKAILLKDKGEYSYKGNCEIKDFKKILFVTHGGIINELVNNFLYRMGKSIIKRIDAKNTALFIIKIFPKDIHKGAKNNNDLIISFTTFEDYSHLNVN